MGGVVRVVGGVVRGMGGVVRLMGGEVLAHPQTNCPCGGNWTKGIARVINSCPMSSCTLYQEDFTRGLPVGRPAAGYGTLVRFGVDHLAATRFSTTTDDYDTHFAVNDYAMLTAPSPGDFILCLLVCL